MSVCLCCQATGQKHRSQLSHQWNNSSLYSALHNMSVWPETVTIESKPKLHT